MIFVYSPRNADSCVPGFFCAGAQEEISRFTACAPRGGQRKRHSPPDGKAVAQEEISRFTAYAPRGGQRKRHSPPDGKAGTQKEIRKERRQDDG